MNTIDALQQERCVILHADDYGMCHTNNRAITQLLREGAVSSTTLMANCPWSLEAARAAKAEGFDVGLHATLTSEWEHYRWGPLVRNGNVDTLVDEQGYLPRSVESIRHADPSQIRAEVTAQIEWALRQGLDLTHLDNHMGALDSFTDIYIDLAAAYRLPLRFASKYAFAWKLHGRDGDVVEYAREKGVLFPDDLIGLPFTLGPGEGYEAEKERLVAILRGLAPGVTEIIAHPSLDTDELKAITDTWQVRRYEFDLFRDPDVKAVLAEEKLRVIGWRTLRDLQRQ
jgi:chitin disaccharide deacetylase